LVLCNPTNEDTTYPYYFLEKKRRIVTVVLAKSEDFLVGENFIHRQNSLSCQQQLQMSLKLLCIYFVV